MAIDNYLGNPQLKAVNVDLGYTAEQVAELVKCSNDVMYFTEKYIRVINVDEGFIPLKLRPYQKTLIKSFDDNRFTICKFPRQYGKSTTYVAYLLWYVLFHENVSVAILANRGQTARELLSRIQRAWEAVPKWMQLGIVTWNKGSIELENKSSIVAANTASSTIRGMSLNIIVLDEFAHVANHVAEDFFNSTYPTISSGKSTKIFIVSTPKGLNKYWQLWQEATKPIGEKTSKFNALEVHWTDWPGRGEEWRKEQIANLGSESAFEQEFGCEFLGSSGTLISGAKLRMLVFRTPISSQNGLDIYQNPIVDSITDAMGITIKAPHTYVLCADTAQGKQLDYSAFIVVDVTEAPYKLVAKYRSNVVSTILFPEIIYDVAKKYNNAHVLVEINDSREVAQSLHYELEYENILTCQMKGRGGQTISGGFGKNPQFGLKMTTPVKKIGCANLKSLIETDKLMFVDADIISELASFIRVNNSYKADPDTDAHDDLVMCLVIFAWLIVQKYFKELIDSDLKARMVEESEAQMEHDLVPFGYIDDGTTIEPEVDSGDVWYPVDTLHPWGSY